MIGQYYFPYSILDFGLTALALLIMGIIGYLFFRFVTHQHKLASESAEKHIEALKHLADYINTVTTALHDVSLELHELREDVYRNRYLLDQAHRKLEAANEKIVDIWGRGGRRPSSSGE